MINYINSSVKSIKKLLIYRGDLQLLTIWWCSGSCSIRSRRGGGGREGGGGGGGGGELKRTWKTCVCCARAAANFFLVIGVGATAATAPELAFLPARMSFNLRSVSCASVQSCLRSYRAAVLSTILLVPYITGRVQLQSLRDTTPSHNGHSSNK